MPVLCITPVLSISDRHVHERFVRASGPGGQNVNKVATAVELRFDVHTSDLPEDVKVRLAALAGKRIGADGMLLIDSRAHRTQAQNRSAARARLLELLRRAATPPKRRKKTHPGRSAIERRLASKAQRARVKARRAPVHSDD
jgi:ribosome-associated protein